jgi:hypothetical protein
MFHVEQLREAWKVFHVEQFQERERLLYVEHFGLFHAEQLGSEDERRWLQANLLETALDLRVGFAWNFGVLCMGYYGCQLLW